MPGYGRGLAARRRTGLGVLAIVLPAVALAGPPATQPVPAKPPVVSLRLPPPIAFDRSVGADSAVWFRHETHVAFASNRCTGCHPKPFRILTPVRRASHGEMNAGGSCGACHDGKQAFGVKDQGSCATCHSGVSAGALAASGAAPGAPAAPAARPLPKPHTYPRAEASPGRVTFRHKTHLQGAVACVACHPKPFSMKFTAPRAEGGMHQADACGKCHDGSASFGVENVETCARCHVAEVAP